MTGHRVLFVCAGNICRSPLAEGIFLHKLAERNLTKDFLVDSAGTGAWHVGERPDSRSVQVAKKHGINLTGHSRQFVPQDFINFDLILAMDSSNFGDLLYQAPENYKHKIKMMRDYDLPEGKGKSVPDPYYGGVDGFDKMYDQLNICCENLVKDLTE